MKQALKVTRIDTHRPRIPRHRAPVISRTERVLGVLLAVSIGAVLAVALVEWWSN